MKYLKHAIWVLIILWVEMLQDIETNTQLNLALFILFIAAATGGSKNPNHGKENS